jgi:predicted oxidoreductase
LTPTELCQRVAAQEKPWTWHLLNWRIAAKEFAISGAEHNQRIRDRQFPLFLKETLLGNHRLVKQMAAREPALSWWMTRWPGWPQR